MGLDAFVPCNCLERGLCRRLPDPLAYEDVYRDNDGLLCSRMLDGFRRRYDRRRYRARFHDLEEAFDRWAESPCEHEHGEYWTEWVSNIAGTAQFRSLVEELGGSAAYPLLSELLPHANGGSHPSALAEATLRELDDFAEKVKGVHVWALVREGSNDPVWTCAEGSCFTWMLGINQEVGMDGPDVFFASCEGVVRTRRFLQVPLGEPNSNGRQRASVRCLDGAYPVFEIFSVIDSEGSSNEPREFWTERRLAPFLHEGRYPTAERIRRLLVASIETGNDIYWC